MARKDQGPSGPKRRMSEFSVEVELLSILADRVAELIQAVAATGGAKPRKVTPLPRPVTAFDRARERVRYQKHRSLVARVKPNRRRPSGQEGGGDAIQRGDSVSAGGPELPGDREGAR